MSNLFKVSYSLTYSTTGVCVPQAPQVSLPRPFQDYTYMNDPFPDEAFAVMPEDDPHSLQEAQEAADWPEWERASHADFFQSNETLPPQHQSHTGQLVRLYRVIYRHS